MEWIRLLGTAMVLLLLGDFVATFGYHVPEHVFGKFHTIVHHSPRRSFIRYAIQNRRPIALLDGFLSAFPYFLSIPVLWHVSAWGVGLGLILAELHVIWRHQFSATYRTPIWAVKICKALSITTPERHRIHHQFADRAFGDIFTFYEKPAELWLKWLKWIKQQSWRGQASR